MREKALGAHERHVRGAENSKKHIPPGRSQEGTGSKTEKIEITWGPEEISGLLRETTARAAGDPPTEAFSREFGSLIRLAMDFSITRTQIATKYRL